MLSGLLRSRSLDWLFLCLSGSRGGDLGDSGAFLAGDDNGDHQDKASQKQILNHIQGRQSAQLCEVVNDNLLHEIQNSEDESVFGGVTNGQG